MYKTSEKKRLFLEDCGFKLRYAAVEPTKLITGLVYTLEVWVLSGPNEIKLHINFTNKKEPNYCELYTGENKRDVKRFPERNLISHMKKLGFDKK